MPSSDDAGGRQALQQAASQLERDRLVVTSTGPSRFGDPEWLHSATLIDYPTALRFMEQRVEAIIAGTAPEAVWLLEHPPIYTCGTSALDHEIIDRQRFPVYRTGRGGRITYHGPGQRVGYVMLDLQRRRADVRFFVCQIEEWLIRALATFGVAAVRCPGKIGVWAELRDGRRAKIAAIGIRIRRWVSFHGFALNVDPDLSHFSGIVPCGLADSEVASLRKLGLPVAMPQVDAALMASFATVFAPREPSPDLEDDASARDAGR